MSGSSEDENLDRCREAVDSQFVNDSMFHQENEKLAQFPQIKKPPSLRPSRDNHEHFNQPRNTAEFQKHVSKHLSKMLDDLLKDKFENCQEITPKTKNKQQKSGVKFFKNSPNFIKIKKTKSAIVEPRKCKEFSLEDNLAKCESVVVDASEIFSGQDTKNWSTHSKAPVYKYRETDKGLVLIEN